MNEPDYSLTPHIYPYTGTNNGRSTDIHFVPLENCVGELATGLGITHRCMCGVYFRGGLARL